jgi:hypothetical protein
MAGNKLWAIAGGKIPSKSTGEEPEFTSREEIYLLNTNDNEAKISITIYYSDRDPMGPYEVTVAGKRVRSIRFNDLINPEAIPLETDFGSIIESDLPIIVQHGRLDTSRGNLAISSATAYPIKPDC